MQKQNLIRLLIIAIGVLILIAGGAVGGIQNPAYDPSFLSTRMTVAGIIVIPIGLYHTDLDCWKRGQKGIIITMGDETLNPYLPCADLNRVTGDTNQIGVETKDLYPKAAEKFDIYHLNVNHLSGSRYDNYFQNNLTTFQEYLGERARTVKTEEVADAIIQIVKDNAVSRTASIFTSASASKTDENGYIVW